MTKFIIIDIAIIETKIKEPFFDFVIVMSIIAKSDTIVVHTAIPLKGHVGGGAFLHVAKLVVNFRKIDRETGIDCE